MRMSKRGRRNSRRRKSSSSSKHSISPCNFQKPTKSPADNVVYEDGIAEKGEADSLRKESILSESDEEEEKESEILSKEKRFSRESHGESFVNKNERPSIAEPGDKGPKITTSMTIDDFEQPSSKIVLKQSHESTAKGLVSSTIAVTTAKVQFISSNMRVEIKEMLQLDDSDIHTTLVLQSQKGKGTEACFQSKCKRRPTPNNESFAHHYSCNPNTTELHQNRKHENVSYKVSIAELSTEAKDTSRNQSLFKCREEMDCCKSCCKDHFYGHHTCSNNNDFTVVDGSSSLSPFSDFWLPEKKQSLPNNLSSQELWDIPPPHQFADREHNVLEDLAEDIASCQICTDDDFNARGAENMSEASRYKLESGCHSSLDEEQRANANSCSEQMSELDTDEPLFMRPTGPMSRSSFTKNVIYNHKMKTRLRNNSIAILESKTQPSGYVDKPVKRRKTFPGLADCSSQSQEGLSSHRESFSSGTLSSFFMQSLPLQAERSGRLYLEDDRLSPFGVENRKSSDCSSYTPSLSPVRGHNMFLPDITTYSRTKNPFKSEENLEEVIFQNGLYPKQMQADKHTVASEMEAGEMVCVDGADQDSTSADPVEQSEVAESAFDEEMVELDEPTEELRQRDLLIQVTPPSPYTSEERIIYGSPTTYTQREHQKRRGSVNTIITGGSEQRFLYSDSKPTEGVIPERHQMDISPSVLPIEDMEADRNCASLHTLTAELSTSTPSLTEPPTEATEPHTDTSPPSEQSGDDVKSSGEAAMALTEMCQKSCVAQDKVSTDGQQKPKLYQMHLAERQSVSKSSLEVKEHLKPPADPILKDPEDTSDHWAKRRKLFKESTQWSSAGGSCITSNTTESADTMNSEEACSVEVSARDIKDRGFYTETFHSAAWIYHGDDVKPAESPRCLSKRPRPVTIRERTVKIIRGPGDYPWGFRIQFSKPIVVTEVDTNGAAEEAGLQVGDYILAVNGTDVTSVPHSEAAELARHGPDILTLTIGSDISRCPNTPRPACRGYLHKRTQSSLIKGWRKRWFVLRHDCCLYYYRHKRDEGKRQPVSAMKLEGALVSADTSLGKPFVFKCSPVSGNRDYYLCATSNQEMKRWLEDMDRAVRPITQNHVWVDVTRHNASLPPLAVKNPECLGLLHQLDKNKDVWVQHYCILKDGCLYFYPSFRSTYAIGGIYLHGYTVREQPLGSKKSTIELKPPSEEFKTFYLCAENPTENKRWMLAMKASLGKWLPLH